MLFIVNCYLCCMEKRSFERVALTFIEDNRLLHKHDSVLVALSGGADSVALLSVLIKLGYKCEAAHCNFRLRGDESERDRDFVAKLCDNLGVRCHVKEFDVPGYMSQHRVSLEMACRELRYEWFEQLRQQLGCGYIAVAHHRDDNIETFFINLLRGGGITGLSGIKPVNGRIIRPLLPLSKDEILQYIESEGLEYVTDSTNLESDFTRNKIRNKILPAIVGLFPDAMQSMSMSIRNLAGAEKIFREAVGEIQYRISEKCGDGSVLFSLNGIAVTADPQTALHELLSPYGFNSVQTSDMWNAIQMNSVGAVFYSPENMVEIGREYLSLFPIEKMNDRREFKFRFDDMSGLPLHFEIHEVGNSPDFKFGKDRNVAYFDSAIKNEELLLRHWKDGDSFRPFGMRGKKKLSDFFNDNKFSLLEKKKVWLLCHDNEILWIVGHRAVTSEFDVSAASEGIIVLSAGG